MGLQGNLFTEHVRTEERAQWQQFQGAKLQADLAAELAHWPGARLATHLEGSVSLYSEDLRGAVAFVFGNEGKGVSAPVLAACDRRVRIPMPGHAESLNVAMAATVCLFERVRQGEAAATGAA